MSEPESVSERELAQQLEQELFTPSSAEPPSEEPTPEPPIEEPPLVVADEPEQPEPEPEPEPVAEPELAEPEEEEEPEEEPEEADEHVVWATKKYGDDTLKWAKALRDNELHISRIAREKSEAEQLAAQWYEYAQQAEQQVQRTQMAAMPVPEEWVDQAMMNPFGYALQALTNGNEPLHNAILARVAEENPLLASQIGTQVQMELQRLATQEEMQYQPRSLAETLGASFQRLGIDLEQAGPQMMEKVTELGEHDQYVQAMLYGDDNQRDLAVRAVYDLVREGRVTKRRVRDEAREATIRREAELRREAAGVVTGAPHTPPPQEDPFLAAMTEEWKARRQWGEE